MNHLTTRSNLNDDRCGIALLPDDAHNLTSEEVRLLWSFIHGDIMNEPTRVRLRKSWGLCARHAWGSVVAEVELWQSGAGHRGGHQPFDAAVLYDDLIGRMSQELVSTWRRGRLKMVRGKRECIICDDVHEPSLPGMALTHGGFTETILADEANALVHTQRWFTETSAHWLGSVCPTCAEHAGESPKPDNPLCRPHLVAAGTFDDVTTKSLTSMLLHLRPAVRALADSMTQRGAHATPEVDASWVRAMGWFHGWQFPLAVRRLAAEPATSSSD